MARDPGPQPPPDAWDLEDNAALVVAATGRPLIFVPTWTPGSSGTASGSWSSQGYLRETGPDGRRHTADELAAVTSANLHDEFATVVTTSQLLAAMVQQVVG